MKFTYHAAMCPADQHEPLAIAVAQAGFDRFTFPDSIYFPKEGINCYPYNDDCTPDTQSVEEKFGMLHWYTENVTRPSMRINSYVSD